MTNGNMVKREAASDDPDAAARERWARRGPVQPMPAPESDAAPVTDCEPMDSPQPKPQLAPGRAGGLTTEKSTKRESEDLAGES